MTEQADEMTDEMMVIALTENGTAADAQHAAQLAGDYRQLRAALIEASKLWAKTSPTGLAYPELVTHMKMRHPAQVKVVREREGYDIDRVSQTYLSDMHEVAHKL